MQSDGLDGTISYEMRAAAKSTAELSRHRGDGTSPLVQRLSDEKKPSFHFSHLTARPKAKKWWTS